MRIYDNLSELEEKFDTFIFDAYGVFYNGQNFYKGAVEYMEHLVLSDKTVIILSNSSQKASLAARGYEKRGLYADRHYNFFVTSGQVCFEAIENQALPVRGNRYFEIGHKADVFSETMYYKKVSQPQEADFAFISVPYLSIEEYKNSAEYKDKLLPAKTDENGNIIYWDSKVIEPFLPLIEKCVSLGLPAINANPDFYASEKHIGYQDVDYVVRNGLIAEHYRQKGGSVYEYGKPNSNVYDYTFELSTAKGRPFAKERTAMIGDTIRTDISGALSAGITPVLCSQTGVTAAEIEQGADLPSLLQQQNIDQDKIYIIRSVA